MVIDKTLENCISWEQDADKDLVGDCIQNELMQDCFEVMDFDLNIPAQRQYLVNTYCVPCMLLYNATKLDSIEEKLKLINKKLIKIEKGVK